MSGIALCFTHVITSPSTRRRSKCSAGAEAFRRDNPNATVEFLDTGHFALETHVEQIAVAMRNVLGS